MELDKSLLLQVLVWIISGGGSATAAYLLMEKVSFLAALKAEAKGYVSLLLAIGISALSFLVAIGMEYYPTPASLKEWIELLFSVAFISISGSKILHARITLRNR